MSEYKIKRVFRFYLPWSLEKRSIAWFEKEAAKGWILESVGAYLPIYTFRKSRPQKVTFHLEYQPKVEPSYYSIAEDSGWELNSSDEQGWLIWSREYEGDEKPQFCSTSERKVQRSRSMLLTRFLALFYFLVTIPRKYKDFAETNSSEDQFWLHFCIFGAVLGVSTIIYSLLKTHRNRI